MEYRRLEPTLAFNDPEVGFSFSLKDREYLDLSLVDWECRRITFRFHDIWAFHYSIASGWGSLPEALVLEVLDSLYAAPTRLYYCLFLRGPGE